MSAIDRGKTLGWRDLAQPSLAAFVLFNVNTGAFLKNLCLLCHSDFHPQCQSYRSTSQMWNRKLSSFKEGQNAEQNKMKQKAKEKYLEEQAHTLP